PLSEMRAVALASVSWGTMPPSGFQKTSSRCRGGRRTSFITCASRARNLVTSSRPMSPDAPAITIRSPISKVCQLPELLSPAPFFAGAFNTCFESLHEVNNLTALTGLLTVRLFGDDRVTVLEFLVDQFAKFPLVFVVEFLWPALV